MARIIVFDFDGTLVDSDTLKKRDAWLTIFPEGGTVPRSLLLDVLSRIPETRFDILREIFQMRGRHGNELEQLVRDYAARYNTAVQEGIARMGLIPGVAKGVQNLFQKYRLYIVSATPEYGVRETVKRLKLEPFFADVLGKPASKEENLRTILSREQVTPKNIVLIGNGEDDRRAAERVGTMFIGIADSFNGWRDTPFPLATDWEKLIPMAQSV